MELCLAPRFRRLQARVLGDRSLSMATPAPAPFFWVATSSLQAACTTRAQKHCFIHLGVGKKPAGPSMRTRVCFWPVECCAAQLLCGPLGRGAVV